MKNIPIPARTQVTISLVALAFFGVVQNCRAEGRCGAGVDLVVQALEKVKADSKSDQLEDANQLLKRATELCSELGDAWYYRSLVERQLGHIPQADFAMRKAKMFSSDASADQLNPFALSTPPRRIAGPGNSAPGNAPAGGTEKWALIIGIGSFRDNHIDPLRYTVNDAQSFADVLLDPKYGHFKSENVHTLTNDQATTRNIKIQLNWLARSAAPDDLVVVYVATHGSSRGVDTVGVNYVITYDTEVGDDGDKIDPDTLYATALPMVDIANAIATRVRATRAAIFLDTCYSGNATVNGSKLIAPGVASASLTQKTLEHIKQGSGRIIFAASGTEEESLESDSLKHGFFTYFLVQALHEQSGSAPLSRIFDYTRQHVSERVATEFRQYHVNQTPVMSRSEDDTDFALNPSPTSTTASLLKMESQP
jgi:uncharacterized caspase-like protein